MRGPPKVYRGRVGSGSSTFSAFITWPLAVSQRPSLRARSRAASKIFRYAGLVQLCGALQDGGRHSSSELWEEGILNRCTFGLTSWWPVGGSKRRKHGTVFLDVASLHMGFLTPSPTARLPRPWTPTTAASPHAEANSEWIGNLK